MRRLLITGIAGFGGSHAMEHVLANTDWEIVGLASFRHRGDPLRLVNADPARVRVHYADLRSDLSPRLIDQIGHVDYIWHLAAESHVDRSIAEPRHFMENNVGATLTILEYARAVKPRAVIQVSTDEVYGPAPIGHDHVEWSPIIPSNPYSAAKAAQEAAAIAYWRTYGVPLVITNTMNLFGERQDPEKFIPMCISRVLAGQPVTVHGSEDRIGSRFYLHARNHADALLWLTRNRPPAEYEEGLTDRPDRYHVRGEREIDNLEMAQLIARLLGRPLRYEFVDFHAARPGHDRRYALDDAKLRGLGWTPLFSLEASLARTIDWTLGHREWVAA